MPLTPVERRRARVVLVAAALGVGAGLAVGSGAAVVAILLLTPLCVYRATGRPWRVALGWATGLKPIPSLGARPVDIRRASTAGPGGRVAAIVLLLVGVPAVLGLLSVLAGTIVGSDRATQGVGTLMTFAWVGAAALLSRMVVASERGRIVIVFAAGAATLASVILWSGVIA